MSTPLTNDVIPLPARSAEQCALVERCQNLIPGGTTGAVVPPEGLEFKESSVPVANGLESLRSNNDGSNVQSRRHSGGGFEEDL